MKNSNLLLFNYFYNNVKEVKILNFFWLGFIIYTLSFTLSTTTYVNHTICQFFQSIGILIFLAASVSLINPKFENKYLNLFFIVYFSWSIIVILRGVSSDYNFFKTVLFDAWFGAFSYFTPLILLFPKKLGFYKKAFEVIAILGLFYITYVLFFINNLLDRDLSNFTNQAIVEYFTKALSLPTGFLLLTYKYHSKKINLLVLFITMVTIFFAIIRARRGLILISISPLVFAYIIYVFKSQRKIPIIIFSILLAGITTIYGLQLFELQLFKGVNDRGLEDTRSSVEECFYRDLTTTEWIIGKGIQGQYYCPGIDPNSTSPYRTTIETDFLQIILKGGIISLVLLLLITVPAAIKGIFFSKNMLSRAAGIWILLWLISLYPANMHTFTLNYLLVWMSVGICYSKTLRNMPESVIKAYFGAVRN